MQAYFNKMEFCRENFEAIVCVNQIQNKLGQIIVPVGKTTEDYLYENIAAIPNIIVSGTTGSGKTAFVRTLMAEIMYKYSPTEARFIIYDSKKVDYRLFASHPYLLIPLINEQMKASAAINWAIHESQNRLNRLDEISNLPHIFLIMDDFSELSLWGDEITQNLIQLFQTARKTKVHCWIITSMPTSAIIPAELKANIATRIAFHTSSKSLSRSIIDDNGAETLRVPGEMIFKQNTEVNRCQAVFLNDDEMTALSKELADRYSSDYVAHLEIDQKMTQRTFDHVRAYGEGEGRDDLFEKAARFIIDKDKAYIGMLQRVLKIGFNRAAHIMDQLCEYGVVGEEEGTKPRKVLMTMEQFELLLEELHGEEVSPVLRQSTHELVQYKDEDVVSSDNDVEVSMSVEAQRRVPLRPYAFLQGVGFAIGVADDAVIVKNDGESSGDNFTILGEEIKDIVFRKGGLFRKGSITIVRISGDEITVTFNPKEGKAFRTFMKQLSADTGKPLIETI